MNKTEYELEQEVQNLLYKINNVLDKNILLLRELKNMTTGDVSNLATMVESEFNNLVLKYHIPNYQQKDENNENSSSIMVVEEFTGK